MKKIFFVVMWRIGISFCYSPVQAAEDKAEAESLSSQRWMMGKDGAFDSEESQYSASWGRPQARGRSSSDGRNFFCVADWMSVEGPG